MTDKTALLEYIRSFRQEVLSELDRLEDAVMSLADLVSDETPAATIQLDQSDNDGWLNAGLLPEGVAFGARSKRWKMSDIVAWQDKSQSHDAVDSQKTITRRRGRVSRLRKIEEFAYA